MRNSFHKTLDLLGRAIAEGADFGEHACPEGYSVAVTLCRVTKASEPSLPDTHDVIAAAESRFRVLDE